MSGGTPISDAAFAAALKRLGPFEKNPHVAVAWSGGGDSTSLLALAQAWASACGGRVTAFHVDHGLRANSADEAAALGAAAAARGISFESRRWTGDKPVTGVMAAARDARLALLEEMCAVAGIWHLLLAHTCDDQNETAALRAARGSGADGLAGMSAIVERTHMRVLRPLLGFPHADLLATCVARGRDWLEDPGNLNPRYARAALRLSGVVPEAPDGLAAARIVRERELARILARCVSLDPAGFALVDRAALLEGPFALACAALARIVRTVGGGEYAPRGPRTEATMRALAAPDPAACTLGHCRIVPRADGRLVIARERANIAPDMALEAGRRVRWDDRFEAIQLRSCSGFVLGALGMDGWARLPREFREKVAKTVPPAARATLPALRDLDGLACVPHLFYGRERYALDTVEIRFRPRHALAGPLFAGPPEAPASG